jgi:aspartyl-tRNA(Asn)/glutamyl-tRNA(Gln) amidotransferase subunit C
MLRDLNSVLDYFAQLNELDTSTVPPMAQVADLLAEGRQPEAAALHLRPDEVAPSLNRERVLACAPDTDGVFFKVPKVIER